MKDKLKRKIDALDQLNKEAQGITDKMLDVNNLRALDNRFNERLRDILHIVEEGKPIGRTLDGQS